MSKRIIAVVVASVVALASLSISLPASAQMNWRGSGPGMMDGQGFGPGMMGNYGQGMMGGCPMMGTTTDGKISTFAEGRIAVSIRRRPPCRI